VTAHEVLQEAQRRGIVLTPKGTALRFRGPKDALNEELRRELVRNKPEIIALLVDDRSTHPCSTCGQFAFAEAGTICYWCREVPHEA